MRPPLRTVLLLVAVAALAGSVLANFLPAAFASRNASGVYSLPAGNPVSSGSTISSTWANSTLSDLGTEVTNSLDRGGRGAMNAPLQCSSGTVAAPGLTFSAETNSGIYRSASHDLRMSINGADVVKWNAGSVSITGDTVADAAGANAGTTSNLLRFGSASSGEGVGSKRTATGNQFGLDFYTGGNQRMSITNTGGVEIPGSTATNPGTAITASYAGSVTFNSSYTFSTVGCIQPGAGVVTVNGVAANSACNVNAPSDGTISFDCYTTANTVNIRICAFSALGSHTVNNVAAFRVWQ